ncbi:hypothetical protein C8R45DRAFT_763528, partial [Mycena sanguinolenta]
PKWMREGYTLLSGCKGEGDWAAVVEAWVKLEKAYRFKTSTAALPTSGVRPEEVGQWIKYGRSTTRKTEVKSQMELVKRWWKWWSSLAPAWREKDEEGKPKTREVGGEWGDLVHPGGNGMLTVLLPLVWWREGEQMDTASEDWLAAVRDVLWV